MWSKKLAVVAVVVGLCAVTAARQQATPVPVGPAIAYDDFMKLGTPQKAERFRAMSPENKASIMRTHAQMWLRKNRDRLSAGQVALLHEAISFVTPELYRNPNDPEQLKKEEALKAKFKCHLRRSDVMEAFGAVRSPVPSRGWLDDLWAWFEDCVVG
jgi:hypothetical protein